MLYPLELAEMERAYADSLRFRQEARRCLINEARTTSRNRGSATTSRTAIVAARRGVAWIGSALVAVRGLRTIARWAVT